MGLSCLRCIDIFLIFAFYLFTVYLYTQMILDAMSAFVDQCGVVGACNSIKLVFELTTHPTHYCGLNVV